MATTAWASQVVLVGGEAVFASVAERLGLEVVAPVAVVMVPPPHAGAFFEWV